MLLSVDPPSSLGCGQSATCYLEDRFVGGDHLLISWSEPVCASVGYSSMSLVSAPSGTWMARRATRQFTVKSRLMCINVRFAVVGPRLVRVTEIP